MAFHDVVMPASWVGYGSGHGIAHQTQVLMTPDGEEYRGIDWLHPQLRFDVVQENMDLDDVRSLKDFVMARQGAAHTFLLTDFMDKTTAADRVSAYSATDVRLGTGDGSTATFSCLTRYGNDTPWEVTRRLHRLSGLSVAVDGTTKTDGTHYNSDLDAGTFTFTAGNIPSRGQAVTCGCEFYVEVRFDIDTDQWLRTAISAFEIGALSAPMVEQKVATSQAVDRPIYGSFKALSVTGSTCLLNFMDGWYWEIDPAQATDVRLPDMTGTGGDVGYGTDALAAGATVGAGGPYFVILNVDPTFSLTLKELRGGSWAAISQNSVIAPGTARAVWLDEESKWRAW